MFRFCREETSQHIYKQVFHNFQKHQTTFCITYQTLENTISIMFWHLFGPNTFWRCWSKEPWKEIPPKKSPKKIYRRSPQIWKWEGPDNRFGGRLSGLALQYIAPSIMCSYLCSSMALFDLFVGLLREIQEGSYITTISAKCMRARHVEGHPVSPAVDWSNPLTIFI